MTDNTKNIAFFGDFGRNDLALFEGKQELYTLAQGKNQPIHVDIFSVDSFNTAQTAALVAEAAASGKYDVVYHNTAPRKDEKKQRPGNAGEFLAHTVFTKDKHSTQVIGVFAGGEDDTTLNTFALLDKQYTQPVHKVDCPTTGSQFRSRDVFPSHVIDAVLGEVKYVKGDSVVQVPLPASGFDERVIAGMRGIAQKTLAEPQLAKHGDATSDYVTVITAPQYVHDDFDHLHERAEIDALPLKSKGEHAWIEASFAATQLALNCNHGGKRLLYTLMGGKQALDGVLYFAHMDSDVTIATDDLRTLYFARDHIRQIEKFEPGVIEAKALNDDEKARLKAVELPAEITPVYIDGYRNIKLAIRHSDLLRRRDIAVQSAPGEHHQVSIQVNGHQLYAYVADGSFHVQHGETALSKGSSGWAPAAGGEKEFFAEIFTRGGHAADLLGSPQPGDHIRITLKKRQIDAAPGTLAKGEDREYGKEQRRVSER